MKRRQGRPALSKFIRFKRAVTYNKAVQEKQSVNDVHFVAVFPGEANDAKQYLKDKGIGIQDVAQAMPNSIGASGFPTLMLLDKTGTVKKAWTGKLSPERELEVIDSIKCINCGQAVQERMNQPWRRKEEP